MRGSQRAFLVAGALAMVAGAVWLGARRPAIPPRATPAARETEVPVAPSRAAPDSSAEHGSTPVAETARGPGGGVLAGDAEDGPAPAAGRLTGVVVDGTGTPIGDARVQARRVRAGQPLATDWKAQDWRGTSSDRRGRFSLDAAPGRLQLSVRANGFLAAELEVTAPGDVTVKLARGGALEVSVLDENGLPVLQARVAADETAEPQHGTGFPTHCQTDARGRCRLGGLASGRYRVQAQMDPGEDRPVSFARTVAIDATVDAPATTAVELRFAPGRTISGKVIDEVTGRALAGVRVVAGEVVRDASRVHGVLDGDDRSFMAGGEAVSDAEGRFEIGGLGDDPHGLLWGLDGYTMPVKASRQVRPGEADVLLRLRRLPRLMGRAIDDAGAPVADLVVNGRPCHAADGRFVISRDPEEETRTTVAIESEGLAPFRQEVTFRPDEDLDLGDVRLSRGRTLRVTVVSATTGQAVRSAEVGAVVSDGAPVATGETGADGTATLRNVPAAVEIVVSGKALPRTRVAVADDAEQVTVRVGAGGRIEGTVRNAADQPIRNLLVEAGKAGDTTERGTTETDKEGRFVFEELAAGDYVVFLPGDGAGDNLGLWSRHVQLGAGESARVDFTESKGVAVSFSRPDGCLVLTLVAGAFPLDAAATVEAERRPLVSSLAFGRTLVLHGVAPGTYTAVCATSAAGTGPRRTSAVHVDVGGSDLEVALPEPTIPVP